MRRVFPVVLTAVFALVLAAGGSAHAAEASGDQEQAEKVIKAYLETLEKAAKGQPRKPRPADVSKKLEAARKFIHPMTLEVIARQEKNKHVSNGLGVWAIAKTDYWLKSYEIVSVEPAVEGTFIVEVKEKNWRVQEGGEDGEGEPASYLVGKFKGKWFVADKKRNETFTKDTIKIGYKGFFDAPPPKAEAAPPAPAAPTNADAATEDAGR